MQPPNPLPLTARQAAWDALWRRLLAEPPRDDDPETDEQDDEERPEEAA